ncbi:MAG: hypothetical protein JRD89_19020 [Deltaproteobacteria bacterium]|nr:hypothetical protein [Deltaproteobacteria bacterium]
MISEDTTPEEHSYEIGEIRNFCDNKGRFVDQVTRVHPEEADSPKVRFIGKSQIRHEDPQGNVVAMTPFQFEICRADTVEQAYALFESISEKAAEAKLAQIKEQHEAMAKNIVVPGKQLPKGLTAPPGFGRLHPN